MRRLLFVVMLVVASPAFAAPVDDEIAKAVAAMGGAENIHALKSLVLRGTHYEGAWKEEYARQPANAVMARMRTDAGVGLRVVGCRPEIPGCDGKWGGFIEGYDGRRGWEVNWPRQRLIRTLGKAEQALKCGAEFLPLFVDYKARGFKAEWLGPQTVLGKKTVAVRVDQEGCSSQTYYFDPVRYDLVMNQAVIPVHARGALRPTISIYAKFATVNGVRWPSVTESVDLNSGEVLDGGAWTSIEANTLKDTKAFEAPVTHPVGGAQVALNMLEAQRVGMSGNAILAIYDRYRASAEGRAADVADDMRWLGFEFLKADDFANAEALWNRMAAENPKSPQFQEYLGDAYVQKGDTAAARAAYDKALALVTDSSGPGAAGIKAKRAKLAG